MDKAEPTQEHRWLEQLVGEWVVQNETPAPGQEGAGAWTETVRSLDGIWFISEGSGDMPGCGPVRTMLTLGYDPHKKRYVGTWVGSMMTYLWVYEGMLDESGKVLTLDCTGPDFERPGETAHYQDIVTIIDRDNRKFTGRVQKPDGSWSEMMTAHYRRKS